MQKLTIPLLLGVLLLLNSCVKDRTFAPQNSINTASSGEIVINEFMANETIAPSINEFGTASDWIELYNNTDSTINIKSNQWYIDTISALGNAGPAYALPPMALASHQFILVWCDKLNEVSSNPDILKSIHSNFTLKKSSGHLILTQKNSSGIMTTSDEIYYGAQTTDVSYGRQPDGSTVWKSFTKPTPGTSNN